MFEHLQNGKPRVAMLGTYLALYDDAFPGYRPRMLHYMEDIADALKEDLCIACLGASCTEGEAAAFLGQAEKAGAEAVLLLSLGYTNSLSAVVPLVATPLPLIFFNTQSVAEITRNFVNEDMVYNHGMQGVQDLACALVRRGRSFGIVTGLIDQPEVKAELLDHLAAFRARNLIRGSRLGIFTDPMPGMGDGEVDFDQLRNVLGIEAIRIPLEELVQAARRATESEIEAARRFDLEHFEPAPDLTAEDHARSSRLEVGLTRLVRKHRLAGLSLSFDKLAVAPGIETLPFLAICKLMAEGVAYAGEGDCLATAGGIVTRCLCGQTNFTEMYTMDFVNNAVLDTHMAECNWRMSRRDRKPRLLRRQFTLADCLPFAALTFSLEPDDITLCDLTLTAEGIFHFITLEATVEDFPPLAGMEIPNFKIRFERDIRPILNEYSLLGGSHHLSMAYGHQSRRFKLLANHLGCRYSAIPTRGRRTDARGGG